ncbi:MAG: translation initiation factor IF-3 [Chitinispirillaceae bacterium]|jgi:translation initiation factor IF-3|nr:translation initiation factor IF-3 [Chitinispirillaceae bacterium]
MPQKRDDDTRINNEIRVPRVRVIGAEGEPLGILLIADALSRSIAAGLDLVEVSPSADPPVCRIMDYGKFKYEKSKKTKEAKKKQHVMHLKEIKLHPKTDAHDFNFKMQHARDFLLKGDRVKITVVFRGREITHIEFGRQMLDKAAAVITDLAQMEMSPKMEGRSLIAIFVPEKLRVKEYLRKQEVERKRLEHEAAAAAVTDKDVKPTAE